MTDRPVTLAVITGAHGVTGEVRIKPFGNDAAGLARYPAFNGGSIRLRAVRAGPHGVIARVDGIADRTGAEALRGTELTVPRSALPPLDDGEFYHTDLIGLPCHSTTGEAIGTCVAVENFGAGDIIEIERPAGKKFMVPIHAVEIRAASLVIDEAFCGA